MSATASNPAGAAGAAVAGATSYNDLVLATPGLAGYWPLNERSGSVAYDLSPAANHAIPPRRLP